MKNVLVTGGGGYVGSILVPKLLLQGFNVRVLDIFYYGKEITEKFCSLGNLEIIQGDIRDQDMVTKACKGAESIIHLAAISNDPSADLDENLTKSTNLDAVFELVKIAKNSNVKRFVNAASSSQYGIKSEPEVTEDLPMEPITLYAKYKAETEAFALQENSKDFTVTSLRPATVCGYSPRMRLDLSVNIMTNLGLNQGKITVFGGEQRRPNVHIQDITDLFILMLEAEKERVGGEAFNVNCKNMTISEIALMAKEVIGEGTELVTTPSDDNRSYYTSSKKLIETLGFSYRYNVRDAICGMVRAHRNHLIPNPLEENRYYNVKHMLELKGQKW